MSVIKFIVFALSCAILSDLTLAQSKALGRCPNVTVETNFDVNAYLGLWYEYARSLAIFELGGKCVKAEYSDQGNRTIGVKNEMINVYTGSVYTLEGTAKLVSETGEAKLEVKFPLSPFAGPYWVLGTDYRTYSVVWGCTNLGLISSQNAWILTRDRQPSAEVLQKAYSVIDANDIKRNTLSKTDQDNCSNN